MFATGEVGGEFEISGDDCIAHPSTGNRGLFVVGQRHRGHRNAGASAESSQKLNIARSAATKAEILAFNDRSNFKLLRQQAVEKLV